MAAPPHPLLDLSPDRRAAALIEAALLDRQAAPLRAEAAPLLARLDPDAQRFGEHLIEAIARLSAQLEAMEQRQQSDRLSRSERMRIDPLPYIPARRRAAALDAADAAEDGPVAVQPGDPRFQGFGWYEAEPTEGGSMRWSGRARCAALSLPALGGGGLLLTLALRAPFGETPDLSAQELFLDGLPLEFDVVSNDGSLGIFAARADLPELPPGSRVTLLLHGTQFADPATGPRRDSRILGLGLVWARLERVG